MTEEQYKKALLLAGKLAIAAKRVIDANMIILSERILQLQDKLLEYDEFIFSLPPKEGEE